MKVLWYKVGMDRSVAMLFYCRHLLGAVMWRRRSVVLIINLVHLCVYIYVRRQKTFSAKKKNRIKEEVINRNETGSYKGMEEAMQFVVVYVLQTNTIQIVYDIMTKKDGRSAQITYLINALYIVLLLISISWHNLQFVYLTYICKSKFF